MAENERRKVERKTDKLCFKWFNLLFKLCSRDLWTVGYYSRMFTIGTWLAKLEQVLEWEVNLGGSLPRSSGPPWLFPWIVLRKAR